MPRKTAGNTTGAGIKLVKIPRDGNLIVENPEVAVGRITSRPAGDILYIYRYITLQAQQPAHLQGVILACRERERERVYEHKNKCRHPEGLNQCWCPILITHDNETPFKHIETKK